MRLAYLGSPEIAVAPLRALVADGHEVVIVVTQPDRRRGRGTSLVATPVKQLALELGLPVTDQIDDVLRMEVEMGVVVAFGRIVRPHVLRAVPMVNLHFSLLPRWRGAAPVERAILAGDEVTGVCVMEVAEGLDTGAIYACRTITIGPDQTADELRRALAAIGTVLLTDLLREPLPPPTPQIGEPLYAAKLEPAAHYLDWRNSAIHLHRVVRVGQAWTTFRGRRLRVLEARVGPDPEPLDPSIEPGQLDPDNLCVATTTGTLELVRVQPEAKSPVTATAWRNGARPTPGEYLGERHDGRPAGDHPPVVGEAPGSTGSKE